MNRRHAIKTMATSLGALLTLPAWANNWTPESVVLSTPIFNTAQEKLLAEIVGTIIPDGEKPGAKALGVPSFIQKMVADCFEPKNQELFKTGLDSLEATAQRLHNESFLNITNTQREAILRGMSVSQNEPEKEFFSTVKSLTIQGYTSSEYVQVNYYNYVMAPGHFYGCVTV